MPCYSVTPCSSYFFFLRITLSFSSQDWNNPYMTWKPQDYGGNKVMNIPPEMLWVPDIVLYNK